MDKEKKNNAQELSHSSKTVITFFSLTELKLLSRIFNFCAEHPPV